MGDRREIKRERNLNYRRAKKKEGEKDGKRRAGREKRRKGRYKRIDVKRGTRGTRNESRREEN